MRHKFFAARNTLNAATLCQLRSAYQWLTAVILLAFGMVNAHAADAPVLSATVIQGASAYTPLQLFETYRNQLGQPINKSTAEIIAAAIETLYARDGYSKPELQMNTALLGQGILSLNVFEARITEVTIKGEPGPYRKQLEDMSGSLRGAQPVRPMDIQRTLQRMRGLPGLELSVITQRDDTQRNAYALSVDAKYDSVGGLVQFTNRGTRQAGPIFVSGQLMANSPFGMSETLGFNFAYAQTYDEYHGVGAFADLPLNTDQTTHAAVRGFHSYSEPSEEPVDLQDKYVRNLASLGFTHAFQNDSGFDWSLAESFELDDLSISNQGTELREDRLRILSLRPGLVSHANATTQYAASLEIRYGLNALGAGIQDIAGLEDRRRYDFLLTRLQVVNLTRIRDRWWVRVDMLAQTSGYVLPYGERFKIGGDRIGRGLEVPEIAGDKGFGGKLELRRDLRVFNNRYGNLSAYGFYDCAATWKQDESDRESAATGGMGLSLQAKRIAGSVELAKPFTHPDLDGKRSASVFAEIRVNF